VRHFNPQTAYHGFAPGTNRWERGAKAGQTLSFPFGKFLIYPSLTFSKKMDTNFPCRTKQYKCKEYTNFPFYRGELPEVQWRRLHRACRTRASTFANGWGRGGTVSRRTANKKLTKLYCPSRKRSQNRLTAIEELKKWRGTTKKLPTFKFVPAPLQQHETYCSK